MKKNSGKAVNQHKKMAMGEMPKVKKGLPPLLMKKGGAVGSKDKGKKGC